MRAENAAADKAELATCELYDHGPDVLALHLSPCTTFNLMHFDQVRVQCAGCLRVRELRWPDLARTRLSHDPWRLAFRTALTCNVCHHGPVEIAFYGDQPGGGAQKMGRISRRPAPVRPF